MNGSIELRKTFTFIEYIPITRQSQSWQVVSDQLPMNLTVSGAYRSDNNLFRIQSSQLAENYLVEFEEMFLDHQFEPGFRYQSD